MYLIIDRKNIHIIAYATLCVSIIVIFLAATPNKKISVSTFLANSDTTEENIEIFDISKGLVIYNYKTSPVFQKEATKALNTITGMYATVNVFPKSGYIVKIPLNPPIQASGKWLASTGLDYIEVAYVIFPIQSEPYLLILDRKSNPLCFAFSADTTTLQKYYIGLIKTYEPKKPNEHSMEELYYDIAMIMLLPYIQEAVDEYYEINTGYSPSVDPWQPDILSIERPNGYRTFLFIVKLEVKPYLGAHISIGVDHITIKVSSGEVKVEEFKHIQSYPVPPWLQQD